MCDLCVVCFGFELGGFFWPLQKVKLEIGLSAVVILLS